jgi:hypothetical protein
VDGASAPLFNCGFLGLSNNRDFKKRQRRILFFRRSLFKLVGVVTNGTLTDDQIASAEALKGENCPGYHHSSRTSQK